MQISEYVHQFEDKTSKELYEYVRPKCFNDGFLYNLTTVAVYHSEVFDKIIDSIEKFEPDLAKTLVHCIVCNMGGVG